MLCRCESGTSVPREQRFLSGMAFSINEVVRVACQSLSDHTKKGQTNWLLTTLHRQTGRFTVCAMQMVTKIHRLKAFHKWNTNFCLEHSVWTGFSLGLEEQDYHFRCSVAPGNFPLERHEKPYCVSAFSTELFETFSKW